MGEAVIIDANGQPRDAQGRFLGPMPGNQSITKANAREMAERSHIARREKAAERAREFVLREIAALSPDQVEDFESAWGAMTGRMAADSYLSDATLQSRVMAFKAVGQATGALAEGAQAAEGGVSLHISSDVAAELLRRLAERREEG